MASTRPSAAGATSTSQPRSVSNWPNASCWRASSPASGARHAAAAKSPVTDGRRSRTRRSGADMDRTPKRGGAVSPVLAEPVTPSVVMRVLFPVPGRSPGCRCRGRRRRRRCRRAPEPVRICRAPTVRPSSRPPGTSRAVSSSPIAEGRPQRRTSLANWEMQLATAGRFAAWAMHLSNRVNTLELRAAQLPTCTLRSIAMMSARMLQIRPAMAWPELVAPRRLPAGERDDRDDEPHQPADQGQREQDEGDARHQARHPEDERGDAETVAGTRRPGRDGLGGIRWVGYPHDWLLTAGPRAQTRPSSHCRRQASNWRPAQAEARHVFACRNKKDQAGAELPPATR